MNSLKKDIEASAAVTPFGYVNTHTGQFFTDVEPCRQGNEGHWRTVYLQPAAVAGPAHWEADDDSRPRSRADLARVLDEWNDTTGCIPRMSSWRVEVLSIIEDAFDLGMFLGEKAHLAPALEAPESHTQALRAIADWPVTDMLMNMDAANMRGIAQRALAAAPQAPAAPRVVFADWEMEDRDPVEMLDKIYAVYQRSMGKPAPDAEMAEVVELTKDMLLAWWGEHREDIRAAMVAAQDEAAPAAPAVDATAEHAAEYNRWIKFHAAGDGDYDDFLRREHADFNAAEAAKLAAQAKEGGA